MSHNFPVGLNLKNCNNLHILFIGETVVSGINILVVVAKIVRLCRAWDVWCGDNGKYNRGFVTWNLDHANSKHKHCPTPESRVHNKDKETSLGTPVNLLNASRFFRAIFLTFPPRSNSTKTGQWSNYCFSNPNIRCRLSLVEVETTTWW